MKQKKRNVRQQHIWFSIWNAKSPGLSPKCDSTYQPTRISNK